MPCVMWKCAGYFISVTTPLSKCSFQINNSTRTWSVGLAFCFRFGSRLSITISASEFLRKLRRLQKNTLTTIKHSTVGKKKKSECEMSHNYEFMVSATVWQAGVNFLGCREKRVKDRQLASGFQCHDSSLHACHCGTSSEERLWIVTGGVGSTHQSGNAVAELAQRDLRDRLSAR